MNKEYQEYIINLNGCPCKTCRVKILECIKKAKEDWDNGKRQLLVLHHEIDEMSISSLIVNGVTISNNADDSKLLLEDLFNFLETEVEIKEEWEEREE